jgi:hypothetical protein
MGLVIRVRQIGHHLSHIMIHTDPQQQHESIADSLLLSSIEKCRAMVVVMVVGVAGNNQQQQTTIIFKIVFTDSDHGDYCQSDDGGSNETTLVLF